MALVRRLLAVLGLGLVVPHRAAAHPGWGLVRDPVRQILYYTDLERVWMVDSAGRRTVAVPNVHTHELRIDREGNLFGEDVEGVGGSRWRYRMWRRDPNGRLSDLTSWRDGFRDDYGLVADGRGSSYWASCSTTTDRCQVKRRLPNGRIEAAGGGAVFARPLNFLAEAPDGSILLADGPDLKRITPADRLDTVATGLSRDRGRFGIMGIHAEPDGTIYVAGFEDGEIVKLDPSGRRSVVARIKRPWQPSAAIVSPRGLWITEYDRSTVRLRLIAASGTETVYPPQ